MMVGVLCMLRPCDEMDSMDALGLDSMGLCGVPLVVQILSFVERRDLLGNGFRRWVCALVR